MFTPNNKNNAPITEPLSVSHNSLNSNNLIELVSEMTNEWSKTLDLYAKETSQLETLSKRGKFGSSDQITYLVGMKKSLTQQIEIARKSLEVDSKNLISDLTTKEVGGDVAIIRLQQTVSDFSEIKAEIELLKLEYLDGVAKHCPLVIY